MKRLTKIIALSSLPFLSAGVYATDTDSDGITDAMDNCISVANQDQLDSDGDRIGDACEVSEAAKKQVANVYNRYFGNGFSLESGAERMGYTFAQPVVTFIPGYGDDSNGDGVIDGYKPVVIVPAGYDPTKDYIGTYDSSLNGALNQSDISGVTGSTPAADGGRKEDSLGNAIYFIDAITGVTFATIEGETARADGGAAPVAESASLKLVSGMNHGVATSITPLDADGDGLTERIYYADVGGNIWRADLSLVSNGQSQPTYSLSAQGWRVYKLAALGADGVTADYAANDRRFFNQIDVVRTLKGSQIYDALLVGSGNIANPASTSVDDMFFMVKDYRISNFSIYTPGDFPLNLTDLEDVSDSVAASEDTANGWYIDFADSGEKVVSGSVTMDGSVYFTTIVPQAKSGCAAPTTLPSNYFYSINIHNASPVVASTSTVSEQSDVSSRRGLIAGDRLILQQIDPYIASDGSVAVVGLDGVKDADLGKNTDKGKILKGGGSYWRTEDQ